MPREDIPEEVVFPALLRAARGAYSNAVRDSLAAAGIDDLPRNGPFVLGGMGNHSVAAADLIRQLGVTKQAASQLVDTLVLRGYLVRYENPADRRRMNVELTERGVAAAAAIRQGVTAIDAELEQMLSRSQLLGLRAGLVALTTIRERHEAGER